MEAKDTDDTPAAIARHTAEIIDDIAAYKDRCHRTEKDPQRAYDERLAAKRLRREANQARGRAKRYEQRAHTPETHQIPILRRHNGIPIVEVLVNGHRCEMMLDTGCSNIALHHELPQKLRLKAVGRAIAQTANGERKVKLYRLNSVLAGSFGAMDIQASNLPRSSKFGLLGQAFWGDRSITIHANTIEIEMREGDMETKQDDLKNAAREALKGNPRAATASLRRLKAKRDATNTATSSSASTPAPTARRDDYTDKQDRMHQATAKAASWLHLAGGALLGAIMTFFKRSFLSFVAAIALIGGMLLAGVGYSISLGFLPQSLFPDDRSIRDIYAGVIAWFSTAQPWEIWGCVGAIALAICVQAYQSWSVATFQNMRRSGATGGKGMFSSWLHRFLFFAVSGLVWYLDFQAILGVSFAGGLAGFALWLWAAFPSEIAAMILQIQKAANDD